MKKQKKIKKGFTLIELLTVIAIIGILAAIIMVNLFTTQTKANDARVKVSMNQIRSDAAVYFSDHNTFTGYTINPILAVDINTKNGATAAPQATIQNDGMAYAVETTLGDGSTEYCIDSAGKTTKDGNQPPRTSNAVCSGTQQ